MEKWYKKKWPWYVSIILLVLGYIIGCFHPIEYFQFEHDNVEISRAESVKIVISIIAAFLTFCAVIVALFKEKLLTKFNKPKIIIDKPAKANIEIRSDKKYITKNETIEATQYNSRLLIKNTGNTVAIDVTLILEKLEFKETKYGTITNTFEPPGDIIKWYNRDEKIQILPNSEKLINIVEIFPPKKSTTPEGKETSQEAELIIGNYKECSHRSKAGQWTATFVLHSQNHKHISFAVNIEWHGKWHGRLVDFENEYTYDIIKTK